MKVETVRDMGHTGIATLKGLVAFDKGNPILDAHIIRGTCPTCGGSKEIQEPDQAGGPDGESVVHREPCPDCKDTPIAVIEPAAWEAALAAMLEQTRDELADEVVHRDEDSGLTITFGQEEADATFDYNADILHRALQSLIPGARVATEIVEGRYDGFLHEIRWGGERKHERHGRNIGHLLADFRDTNDAGNYFSGGEDVAVAILAPQAREEVEE
jgi:hypothetical protein